MSKRDLDDAVRAAAAALREDRGSGDITSRLTIPAGLEGIARIVAKQELVVSGMRAAEAVFGLLPDVSFKPLVRDADRVKAGRPLAEVKGEVRSLLAGERSALNFLQHLSGIATLTAKYVEAVRGTKAVILDTRKTIPGLRRLEKAAVAHGGGCNHRMGLWDAILIKDNHVDACGGVEQAIKAARSRMRGGRLPIQVEVRDLPELEAALRAGVESVLLDNMTPSKIIRAVARVRRTNTRTVIEASGGITLRNVRGIAAAGVDRISIGGLTLSAPAVDIAMKHLHGLG